MSKNNLAQHNQVALERCQRIEASMEALAKFVAGRKTLAAKNALPNWGYVGDLGHIETKLAELVEVHGGGK